MDSKGHDLAVQYSLLKPHNTFQYPFLLFLPGWGRPGFRFWPPGTHPRPLRWVLWKFVLFCDACDALRRIATHCDALRRTATHCDAFPCFATLCDALRRIATRWGVQNIVSQSRFEMCVRVHRQCARRAGPSEPGPKPGRFARFLDRNWADSPGSWPRRHPRCVVWCVGVGWRV